MCHHHHPVWIPLILELRQQLWLEEESAIETQISTANILLCCSISSSSTQKSTQEDLFRLGLAHSWFHRASAISCGSLSKICLKIFGVFPTWVINLCPKTESVFLIVFHSFIEKESSIRTYFLCRREEGSQGTSWHCPRLIWNLWPGTDLLQLFSVPQTVCRLS